MIHLLDRASRRAMRGAFERERLAQPTTLRKVPREEWPQHSALPPAERPFEVWRSQTFLVQFYADACGYERMSVNRALWPEGRDWLANITWDELQACKREAGRGDRWAVECYPADCDVVNVANMRHLWLLPEAPAYGWHGRDA